jgi:hypothetical protein
MSRAIMQQALTALNTCDWDYDSDEEPYKTFDEDLVNAAAAALKAALAKPEQEPVSHLWECIGRWSAYLVTNGKQGNLAPPEWLVDAVKAATSPPRKEWVGLTDEEIKEVLDLNVAPWSLSGVALQHVMDDARALEAKLKEKNGVS